MFTCMRVAWGVIAGAYKNKYIYIYMYSFVTYLYTDSSNFGAPRETNGAVDSLLLTVGVVWFVYTAFFSTNIGPRMRDREQKIQRMKDWWAAGPMTGTGHRIAPILNTQELALLCKALSWIHLTMLNKYTAELSHIFNGYDSDLIFICAYASHSPPSLARNCFIYRARYWLLYRRGFQRSKPRC